jgi:sugar O-acyltransferase (sialic acid O-acetyltransferase NeuD family)
MADHQIILQGGGQHAQVVLDCLLAAGANVIALFDPKYNGDLFGIPQRGGYDASFKPEARAVIAIGDNALRKKVSQETRHSFTNAIHPSAIVSRFSEIGVGNMLLHGVIIQPRSRIGNHVILNTGAKVDHDCLVSDFVHLAPGSILCGCVSVGEGTFVGAGSTIIPGKKIGAWSIIGAGSVVISDIPDYSVAVGNPAKVIKSIKP